MRKTVSASITLILIAVSISGYVKSQNSHDAQPSWSPSASKIAFVSNRSGNSDLWIYDIDNNSVQNVTIDFGEETRLVTNIEWKPDETQLLFNYVTSSNHDIWSYSIETNQLVNLTNSSNYIEGNAKWSPTEDRIIYISNELGNADIWIMDADGSNKSNLTSTHLDERNQNWSHDGNFISYSTDDSTTISLNIMDVSTDETITISENAGDAVWSPNGCCIAFISLKTKFDIDVYYRSNQVIQNLTEDDPRDSLQPTWSPNGNHLYFVADDREQFALIKYSIQSGEFQTLIEQPTQIAHISVSSNEEIAFLSFASGNADIWVMDSEGNNLRNITESTKEFDEP